MYVHMCMYIKHEKMCFHYHKTKKNTTLVTPPHTRLSQHKGKNDKTLPRPNEKMTPSQPPIPDVALVIALIEALVLEVLTFCFQSLKKHTRVKYDPKFLGSVIQTFLDQ